jgi:UDP-N-acetylglucosamine 4,6-dehydratase/5-epimerase
MKKIFITGASGTVGSSFIRNNINKYHFYSYSRNEKAQVLLKRIFSDVEIILGSVEDKLSLDNYIRKINPDIIIHAAAMKHVDSAEKQPYEMVKSNIIGSKNIIDVAKENRIALTIGISTDKACYPKNLYGYSKKIMEKMFLEANSKDTRFCCTRFGNIAGSNGSVIPLWLNKARLGEPLTLTSTKMTRLMISKNEASQIIEKCIDLVESFSDGFILSKKMKKVAVIDIATNISKNIIEIGVRPGEELSENLISEDELKYTDVHGEYILIYNKINKSFTNLTNPLNSNNAQKMSNKKLMLLINHVKEELENKQLYY